MTDRSATSTIKGYFYQFDQTILRLLDASRPTSRVVVEGVEDIDLDDGDQSAFVQCKYYEGTEYNHSVVKDAVIQMLRHFHAAGCPGGQYFKYRLFGHYKGGQHKLILPLTSEFVKDNFLTYTRDKIEHKVHTELSITPAQLSDFMALLDIDIGAPSYEEQQQRILTLLVATIPGCDQHDAQLFYYPNAINVVQGLAIEPDVTKRGISKADFVKALDRKDAIFSAWLQQKFGSDYFARLVRRKYFRSTTPRVRKASRFFVIDMANEFDLNRASATLIRLGEIFSHKEHRSTPAQDRFCPFVLLRNVAADDLIALKANLWKKGVLFGDGYPFHGAAFDSKLLSAAPTKDNLSRIKFVPGENELAAIASAITGSVVEIYDFYKTTPLHAAQLPKDVPHYTIRSVSSYFIEEVMQA